MKDELGDRFKAAEHAYREELPRRAFYVVRVDGRAFHTLTRGLPKPFCTDLMGAMDETAEALAQEVSGALCAYVQSDEISIVFTDLIGESAEPWFGGVIQKIVSVTAALASVTFDRAFIHPNGPMAKPPMFDSRVFALHSVGDVADYLWWRQSDCRRNAVSMLAHHYIGKKAIEGLPTRDRVDILAQFGVNVDEVNRRFMNGGLVAPVTREMTTTYTHKRTQTVETAFFDRTVWETEPAEKIRNWFYDTHIDRFPE